MSENGKGSKQRPRDESQCSKKQFAENWSRAFQVSPINLKPDTDSQDYEGGHVVNMKIDPFLTREEIVAARSFSSSI